MSKVYLTYKISRLDPDSNLPFSDGSDWTGDDAVVYSNYRKEVLMPLASLYYGVNSYSNSVIKTTQFSFANTALALEYRTKRRDPDNAHNEAMRALRAEKMGQGLISATHVEITLTDENGVILSEHTFNSRPT